ncbi:MAG TPA: hypothetical protein VFT13_08090 [Candidatus Krumholzibacteria bacterium]|nr:hypothetical protein [Candidatus Krumholzibacteria bacterium]
MKRGVLTAVVLAVAIAHFPNRADSAGVYENAAAESAFLLSPQRVVLRANLEVSRGDSLDATIYRIYAAFPVRTAFLVAVEQPLVTVTDDSDIDSGVGDFMVRLRGRIVGQKRALWALGSLGAGTGEVRFFPYSSESVDLTVSMAYTDSLGALDLFAVAGYVWAQRIPATLAGLHDDHARFSAGAGLRLGDRGGIRAGVVSQDYTRLDVRRELIFAGAGYRWTDALRFFLEAQAETGPVAGRASDWAATAGIAVHF